MMDDNYKQDMITMGTSPQKRKKRQFGFSAIVICIIIAAAVGFAAGKRSSLRAADNNTGSGFNTQETMDKINLLKGYIDSYYLNEINDDNLKNGIYHGFVSGLGDPYSEYYTEQEYADIIESDEGEYRGIGIVVYKDTTNGYVVIESVMKDQPAYNAGIENGDILISVDGKDTVDMTLSETVSLIKRGESDTTKLVILRDNKTLEKEVNKSNIVLETVSHEMKEGDIGYISVSQFIETTDEDFISAFNDLDKQGMKGLIIDLRDNGGGLVDSCTNMLSRIIPEGDLLVYMEDKNGNREEYKSDQKETFDKPVIILVNGNTASASEIFTGCLKDYDKATVLGSKTFGKGIVQSILPLQDGTALKLTISEYYTPKGNKIQKKGIQPDKVMEYTSDEWAAARKDPKKDTQLQEALSILQGKK